MLKATVKNDLIRPRQGRSLGLCLAGRGDDHDKLLRWICGQGFLACETSENKVETAVSGRVSVYIFRLPCIGKDVVMKVSAINPDYKWNRRIELFLRRCFRGDHNAAAFRACCALRELGVATAVPLALWHTGGGMRKKTYFLYEKIAKSMNGEQLILALRRTNDDRSQCCIDRLLANMLAVIRRIHDLGWRHGDPVPKNFLLDIPKRVDDLRAADLQNLDLHLIDYDKCHRARIMIPCVKKFFDRKCLRGFVRFGFEPERILREYRQAG